MIGWEAGAGVVGGDDLTERVLGAPQSHLPIHLSQVNSNDYIIRKLKLYVLALYLQRSTPCNKIETFTSTHNITILSLWVIYKISDDARICKSVTQD